MPRAALGGVGVTMLGGVIFVAGLAVEAVVLNFVLAALPLGVSELGIRIRVMAIADGAFVFEFVAAAAATRCGGWVARRGSRRRAKIGTRALCGVGAVLSAVVLGALSLERGSTVGQWLVGIGLVGLGATLGGTHWRRPGRADREAMSDEDRPAGRRPARGSLRQMVRTAAAGALAVAIGLVGPTMAAAGSGPGDGGGAAGAPQELPAYTAPAGQAADSPPLSACILSQESVDVSSSSIVVVLASGSDVSLTEYEQPTKTGELQWLVSAGFSSDSGLGAVVGAQYEWSDANVGLGLGLGAEATAGVEVSSSLTWSFGSAGKSAADALIAEFASRDADDESGVMSLIDAALNSGSVPPQPIETAYHFGVEATASASGSVTIPVMDGIGVALGGNLDGQVSALAGVSVNRLLGQRTYDFVLQGSASGGASAGVEVGIGELGLEVGVGVQGNSNDEFTAGLTVNSKGTPVALSFGTDVVGGLNVGPVVGVSAGGDDEVGSGDQDEASLFDLGADVDPSLNVAGGEPRLALDEQFELSNKSMLAAGLAILEAAWPDFSLLTALQLPATSTMPTPSAVQTLLAELGSAKGQLGLQLYSETSQTDQESQFAIGVGVGFAVSGEETTSSSTLLSADFWADNALVPWAACPPQAAQPADQVFAAALTPMEDATGFHVVQTAPGFSETMDVEQHAVSAHLVITEQEPGTPEQKPATPEGTFDVVVINGKEYVRGADTASVGSLLVTLRRDPSDAATLVGTWLEVPLQVQGGDLEEFSPTGFGECMAQHGTLETIGVREYPPPDGSAAVPVVAVPVLEIDDKGDPAGTVQQRIYIDLDITAYGSIIEDDQLAASVAGSTPVDCGSDNLWLHTVFSAYGDDVAITAPADPVVLGG